MPVQPNLAASIIQEQRVQARANGTDKDENKLDQYGAIGPWIKDTVANQSDYGTTRTDVRPESILSQDLADALQSPQSIKPAGNPTGNPGDSNVFQLQIDKLDVPDTGGIDDCITPALTEVTTSYGSYSLYTFGFDISWIPDSFNTNELAETRFLMTRFKRGMAKMMESLNQLCLQEFALGQNTYWPTAVESPISFFPESGNVLQVSQADRPRFYNKLQGVFRSANFVQDADSPYRIIHGSQAIEDISYFQNQGTANSENLNFQFVNNLWDFNFTNIDIPTKPGVDYTVYAQPSYSNFILPFVPSQYYQGDQNARISGTEGKIFYTLDGADNEYLGMPMAVLESSECVPNTAPERGVVIKKNLRYQLAVYVGQTYNSDPANQYGRKFEIDLLS